MRIINQQSMHSGSAIYHNKTILEAYKMLINRFLNTLLYLIKAIRKMGMPAEQLLVVSVQILMLLFSLFSVPTVKDFLLLHFFPG